MAAESPRRGRPSTRQRDILPTPPPRTSNHATAGHRGRSQTRRETAPPANPNRHSSPQASRNNSRTRPSSRSRLGDWLQNNATIPIPQSEHFYSNHATAGSTTTGTRNRGPPPASMRGWDRVWSQTPSLFRSQRRSHSHSRDAAASPSLFGSHRQREGSQAREVSRERAGRSSSIPSTRNPNPDPSRNIINPNPNPNPPNFSRPRSISRDYRFPPNPIPTQNQNPNPNFSRPRAPSRNHHQQNNFQTPGIFDPRDRIQTGFAETIRTESTRRGRDGVAYADREVFGIQDPRDRIATGFAETVRSFRGSGSKGASLRRRR